MLKQRSTNPYLWLLPTLIILIIVICYPWIWTFYLSFTKWSPLETHAPKFIGLINYIRALRDPLFIKSTKVSIQFTLSTVIVQLLIGFSLALIMNKKSRFKGLLRSGLLIPMFLTPVVVSLGWKLLLHDTWGILNWLFSNMGFERLGWLSDPSLTIITVSIIDAWQHIPFVFIVLLAGLKGIPNEQYEAGRVDGANGIQLFFHITLPWLKSLIFTVLLFRITFAIRSFDVIYALFKSGGPGNAGRVIGVHLYDKVRIAWNLGEGSALAILLVAFTILITSYFIVDMYKNMKGEK